MTKSFGKLIIYSSIIISVIIIAILVINPFGTGLLDGYSVGRFFELSLSPNILIKCSIEDVLQLKYTSGKIVEAMTAKDTFIPLISYDLVNRNTREKLDSFPSDIYLTCDVPANNPVIVSGSFLVYATATDPTGRDITVYQKTITIPEKVVPDNKRMKLPSYTITQKEIDSLLPVGSGEYFTWIRVHTAPHLTFKIPSAVSTSSYSGSDLLTSYNVKVIKEVPISSAAKGTQVSITSFSPKIFNLPFISNTGFITIDGQVDEYALGEGLPYVIIRDKSSNSIFGNLMQKIRFTEPSNKDNDKWTEFRLTIKLPDTIKTGTYTIEMGSDQPLRGKSTRTFEVLDTPAPTKETTTNNPQPTTTTTTLSSAKLALQYEIDLDSTTIKNDVTKEEGIKIDFIPLQFIKAADQRFIQIIVKPIMTLDNVSPSDYSSTISNLSYDAVLMLQSDVILAELPSFNPGNNRITRDTDGYYHFPAVSLTSNMIEKQLITNQNISQVSPTDMIVKISISGTFDLTNQADGKKFRGTISNAGIKYPITYDPTKPYNPVEPCQELSGQEVIDCKADNNIPPSGSGGYCEGLNSLECKEKYGGAYCVDFFGLETCFPTASTENDSNLEITGKEEKPEVDSGILTICDGDLSKCIELPKNPLNSLNIPNMDNTIIYIGLGILLAIIIAVIIAKRK